MKLRSLILAFPVLCLACNNPGSPTDPASQMDVNPIVAKSVVGVHSLTADFNYEEPCTILGEDYIRSTFKLEETTKLEEADGHDGCSFAWEGNKVIVSFGGEKPFASVFTAEYMFDKLYQGKHSAAVVSTVPDSSEVQTATSSEGEAPNAIVNDTEASANRAMTDNQPQHGGVSAATPPLTKPAVSGPKGKAVADLGDKAIWDESKGAMHVLYNNHIINVLVETKGNPALREEQAKSLAEVLIDKIAENEYTSLL